MSKAEIKKSLADEGDMKKINAFTRRELTSDEVYTFTLRLCDNDIDRDFECFSYKTLVELAPMFKGKTGIFDHSMKSSDQKARIYDTFIEHKKGEVTAYGEPLYSLMAKAYMLKNEENSSLIAEIDAGIKKEVSVSCSVDKSICSVCSADKRRERCEHTAGKRYGGKLCYTKLEGATDAYEFSFVAVPAQKEAGVTKAYKIKEDFKLEDIVKTIKTCNGGVELSARQAEALSSYIDGLETDAALGDEYKKSLVKEVIKLFALEFPELDREVISSVTSVMTAKELKSFKEGLQKNKKTPAPQLLTKAEAAEKTDYSQFRI